MKADRPVFEKSFELPDDVIKAKPRVVYSTDEKEEVYSSKWLDKAKI